METVSASPQRESMANSGMNRLEKTAMRLDEITKRLVDRLALVCRAEPPAPNAETLKDATALPPYFQAQSNQTQRVAKCCDILEDVLNRLEL